MELLSATVIQKLTPLIDGSSHSRVPSEASHHFKDSRVPNYILKRDVDRERISVEHNIQLCDENLNEIHRGRVFIKDPEAAVVPEVCWWALCYYEGYSIK